MKQHHGGLIFTPEKQQIYDSRRCYEVQNSNFVEDSKCFLIFHTRVKTGDTVGKPAEHCCRAFALLSGTAGCCAITMNDSSF